METTDHECPLSTQSGHSSPTGDVASRVVARSDPFEVSWPNAAIFLAHSVLRRTRPPFRRDEPANGRALSPSASACSRPVAELGKCRPVNANWAKRLKVESIFDSNQKLCMTSAGVALYPKIFSTGVLKPFLAALAFFRLSSRKGAQC